MSRPALRWANRLGRLGRPFRLLFTGLLLVCLLGLFALPCLALTPLEFAQKLLDSPSKNARLKLLFSGQSYKDERGNLDLERIMSVLKTNSLFSLELPGARTLTLSFRASADATLFFKIINDALSDAGFVYFIPSSVLLSPDKKGSELEYTISLQSQYLLDPAALYRLLKQNGVAIISVSKSDDYGYVYELDFSKARLKTRTSLTPGKTYKLEKPLKDYVLALRGAKSLIIDSSPLDRWFPKLYFLDKNLNLIKAIRSPKRSLHLAQAVPSGAVYVIISDLYSLDNIRRGLSITLKN